MNRDLLKRLGYEVREFDVGVLHGYDILIGSVANLVPSPQHCVYGILVAPRHEELALLYRYTEQKLGTAFLPRAVLVTTLDGKSRPALCYLASQAAPGKPAPDYLELILQAARDYGFPEWYLRRLQGFRP